MMSAAAEAWAHRVLARAVPGVRAGGMTAMETLPKPDWTPEDTARAQEYWAEYQRTHDVSGLTGQTAAIDPKTGRVWIAADVMDIAREREAQGDLAPVYLVRVGYDYYLRKGHRLW